MQICQESNQWLHDIRQRPALAQDSILHGDLPKNAHKYGFSYKVQSLYFIFTLYSYYQKNLDICLYMHMTFNAILILTFMVLYGIGHLFPAITASIILGSLSTCFRSVLM